MGKGMEGIHGEGPIGAEPALRGFCSNTINFIRVIIYWSNKNPLLFPCLLEERGYL